MRMKKFYGILLILFLLHFNQIEAQQVFSVNGGVYESDQVHLSWSTGEPVISTLSGTYIFTQGFQQPSENILFQLLNIPSGWSGISTYLNLINKDFETIFGPYQNDLVVLSSMTGIYYPAQSISTIGEWDYYSGYQVKAENAISLNLAGHSFGDAVLEVVQGWNLMPVLSRCAVPVEELFQMQESVIIAKEVAGSNLYWPDYGINTLGEFLPGKSYYVAFETDETITFPQCAKALAGSGSLSGKPVSSPWNEIDRTAGSHSIAVPASILAKSGISAGDILGVFTPDGICAGVTEVKNPERSVAVTAYGDDEITAVKNGFYVGENFQFKIYKPESGKELDLEVNYDLSLPQSGYYIPNGLSAISDIRFELPKAGTEMIKTLTLYPNPTTGKVYLKMNAWPGELSVTITNAQQSLIAEYMPEAADLHGPLLIDLGSKPAGVYFFTISGSDFFSVRKVIMQ